jgi:hypothetical protein
MHRLGGEDESKEFDAHQKEPQRERQGGDPQAKVELRAQLVERHRIFPTFGEQLPRIPGPHEADRGADDHDCPRQGPARRVGDQRGQNLDVDMRPIADQPG